MNTLKKLIPIKCNSEIYTQRYEQLKSKIPGIRVDWFRASDWETYLGVGKINNSVLSGLLEEYYNEQKCYWEPGTTMNNYYDSDLADDDLIITGSNDDYLGVIGVCGDKDELVELLLDIINDSNVVFEPSPVKDNSIITPMVFAPYEI